MKGNKKKINDGLLSETEQAVFILSNLFQDYTSDMFINGILHWLCKIGEEALRLFLSLPELLEDKYSLEDVLEGSVAFPGTSERSDYETIGAALVMFNLVDECWDLFGEKIHNDPDAEWPASGWEPDDLTMIKELLEMITLQEIQHRLAASIKAIVGEDYHELFLEKVAKIDKESRQERPETFQNDPELKEHMTLMLWWGHMRLFLEASYFYFGEKNARKLSKGKAKKK